MRRMFLSLFAFAPFALLAQQPLNPTCETAYVLNVSATNTAASFMYVNSSLYTTSVADPVTTCSGSTANRAIGWYRFTATATRHWVITEGPKMDGHTIEVFSGTCGSLASIWCQGNGDSYIPLTGLTAGDMYYVRVIGYPPFISGTDKTEMGLAVVSDPPHDECAGAIELPVVSAGISAYPATPLCTLGATQSLAACTGDPSSSDDDVWYRFTATGTAHHFSSITQYGTGGMPIIQWFSGACGSLTSLVCDGPMATGLTPGQEYHIRLHSTSTSPDFTLRLNGDVHESALNDECDGALPINVALSGEEPEEVTVSTLLGTSSTVPCDVQPSDVWLTFTAPTDRVAVYTTVGHDLSIFSGSCGSLVCEGEGSTSAFEAEVFDGLTPGSTYFLKMGNALYALGNTRVRIYAAPSNDECGNATQLDVLPAGTGAGFTQGTTYIATTGDPACGITAPPDVWYTFTAMAATHLVSIVFPEYTTSAKMEVLNGTCGSLTSVLCDDVGSQPTPITGLQLGTEYHVRIFTNGAERLVFGIGITEAMVNDECLGATVLPGLPLAAIPNQPSVFPVNATASGSGTCGGSIEDVWYRFTPTATEATFLAAFPYGSSGTFGNYIELLSGTCGSLTPISCVNSVGPQFARSRFTGLTIGTEYHVRFATGLTSGIVPVLVQAPANDGITNATVVPRGSNFAQVIGNGSGYGATQSLPPVCGSGSPDDDTWYRFTATATSHSLRAVQRNVLFAEETIPGGLRIEAFDTLSTIPDTLEAHNIGCQGSTLNLTGLTVGHDYWYRVFTTGNAADALSIFGTWYTDGEDSDDADGAAELSYTDDWSYYFNTAGATQSLPDADCLMADNADDDIWFKFTASGDSARLVVGYHTADLALELFSGTPGNLTSLACSDNVLVLPALTNGQTYYARLYSRLNATPVEGRIGLFVTPSLTANVCVDEACLGPVLIANPSIEQGAYCLAGFVGGGT